MCLPLAIKGIRKNILSMTLKEKLLRLVENLNFESLLLTYFLTLS